MDHTTNARWSAANAVTGTDYGAQAKDVAMVRKTRKKAVVTMEHFVFEIGDFEADYSMSVNPQRYEEPPWWEHAKVAITTNCVFPPKLAGRPALVELVASRDFWTPYEWQKDKNWRPLGVGLLELPPTAGGFYASIPHDSMPLFLTAMTQKQFRYVLLYGPALSRGKSLCRSIDFQRSVDLSEY